METEKKDFVSAILDFVNIEDIAKLTDRECKAKALAMTRLAGVADHVLFAIREDKRTSGYSGGVLSQGKVDLKDTGACRVFLNALHFRLGLVFTAYFQGEPVEPIGDINYSFVMEKEFRLAITPEVKGDVFKILIGLAWALHGVPADRIKKCVCCDKTFFQSTATNKTSCGKKCAVKVADGKRRGTERRKETVRRSSIKQYAGRLPKTKGYEFIPTKVEGRKKMVWKEVRVVEPFDTDNMAQIVTAGPKNGKRG